MSGADALVAVYSLAVGTMILGLWIMLLARRRVPEVARGERAIWFHISAEVVTAALLLTGGTGLLVEASWSRLLAGVALGSLLYTVINSPGFYLDRGEPGPVLMFGILAVLTIVAIVALVAG